MWYAKMHEPDLIFRFHDKYLTFSIFYFSSDQPPAAADTKISDDGSNESGSISYGSTGIPAKD